MNYKITNFEKIMLRKICKRIVIQSPEHKNNIKEYYKIMFEESHKDFTEDNHITLTSFLSDCHDEAQVYNEKNWLK